MTINEMHVRFRTIGQAKGLQIVRAVLPESIDEYLNAAIIEKCRSVLVQNTSTQFQDKMTIRDNPMSPYNALRTLFREKEYSGPFRLNGEYYICNDTTHKNDVLAYLSVGIQYGTSGDDNHDPRPDSHRRYPCRIIEPDKIYYILNDFCDAPSKEYPCCVIDSLTTTNRPVEIQIYTALNSIYKVYIGLIDMPAKVSLSSSIDCNLPDYLHDEIVELAVNKFFVSVGSTSNKVT